MKKLWSRIRKIVWTLRVFNRLARVEDWALHCLAVIGGIGACGVCGVVREKDYFEVMKHGRVTELACKAGCVKPAKRMGWRTKGQIDAALQQQARKLAKESDRNEKRKQANDPTEHQAEQDGRPETGEEATGEQGGQSGPRTDEEHAAQAHPAR